MDYCHVVLVFLVSLCCISSIYALEEQSKSTQLNIKITTQYGLSQNHYVEEMMLYLYETLPKIHHIHVFQYFEYLSSIEEDIDLRYEHIRSKFIIDSEYLIKHYDQSTLNDIAEGFDLAVTNRVYSEKVQVMYDAAKYLNEENEISKYSLEKYCLKFDPDISNQHKSIALLAIKDSNCLDDEDDIHSSIKCNDYFVIRELYYITDQECHICFGSENNNSSQQKDTFYGYMIQSDIVNPVHKFDDKQKLFHIQNLAKYVLNLSKYFKDLDFRFDTGYDDPAKSNLRMFHYNPQLLDPRIATERILQRSLNCIITMHYTMGSFLKSFDFKNNSVKTFLNESINFYRNMPNNYGILEYYIIPNNKMMREIDKYLDFTYENILYERLLIVNSKILVIRTVSLQQVFSTINSIPFIEKNQSLTDAKISQTFYHNLQNRLVFNFTETLEILEFYQSHQRPNLFAQCPANMINNLIENNESVVYLYYYENPEDINCDELNEVYTKLKAIMNDIGIEIQIIRDSSFECKNIDDSSILDLPNNCIYNNMLAEGTENGEFFYWYKGITVTHDFEYNNVKSVINTINSTSTYFLQNNIYNITLIEMNMFVFKFLDNFYSDKEQDPILLNDERYGHTFSTPKSGPYRNEIYRAEAKHILSLEEFLKKFMLPVSKITESKLSLVNSDQKNIYMLAFIDAGHIDTLKLLKIIETFWYKTASVDIIFGKFFSSQKHDHIKSFSDYVLSNGKSNKNSDFKFETSLFRLSDPYVIVDDHVDVSLTEPYEITGYWNIITKDNLAVKPKGRFITLSKPIINYLDSNYPPHCSETKKSCTIKSNSMSKFWSLNNITISDPNFIPIFTPRPGLYTLLTPQDKHKYYIFGSDNDKFHLKSTKERNDVIYNPKLPEFGYSINKINDSTDTIHILTFVYGDRYVDYLLRSMESIVQNQTYYMKKQEINLWIPRNYITVEQMKRIGKISGCTLVNHEKETEVCIEVKFVPAKWFQGLYDTHVSTVKQIQLLRVIQLNTILPHGIKRLIIKDADQIMQYGSLSDLTEVDMVFQVRDRDDKYLYYSKHAVFAYPPYCEKSNPEFESYRFWESDNFRRYYNNNTYHFAGFGVVDMKYYNDFGTQKGMILAYNSLKWKEDAIGNLDQDLLHIYQMINQVISFEENVLWCDTWCHRDLKEEAYFIDFCNKPSKYYVQ